jgi:sensor histidine kinase YesM
MKDRGFKPFRSELNKVFVGYALTPVIIFTVIAFLLIFVAADTVIRRQNVMSNKAITRRLENTLQAYSQTIVDYSLSPTITQAILHEERRREAYEQVYEFINHQEVRCNFYFFNADREMVMSNTLKPPDYIMENMGHDWGLFGRMRNHPDIVSVSINRVYSSMNKYSIFTLCKAVQIQDNIEGYLVFELLENDVFNMLSNVGNTDTIITDRFFNVALATNNNYTDNFTKLKGSFRKDTGVLKVEEQTYFLCRGQVLDGIFQVYTMTPLNYYRKTFVLGGAFLAVLFVVIALAMVMWAKRISARKTTSIDEIVRAIQSVQEGNLDTKLTIDSHDEFQIIAQAFNQMLWDIKDLIEKNKEETQRSMMAEVKQLESQFNPHFLFNTLETIRCMVKYAPNDVDRIIISLSSLLRYSINNTVKTVPLGEDLEHTKNYLEILKYRFGERLDYEISIEEEALDCIVPKLLTQPIIENAVKHGFEGREHLYIRIKGRFFDEHLVLVIYDDGAGIDEEKLKEIQRMLKSAYNQSSSMGLYNVSRRMQLMYGRDYGLDIISEKNAGTTVKITIPVGQ